MAGKNPGPTLYFSRLGGEQPIPPEFIAAMERSEEVTAVPDDVDPDPLSDTVVESDITTNRTDERVRKTVKKKPGNIVLHVIRTDDDGAPVQVTQTLYPTGTQPAVPSATTKVAVQDLGNGWSIQEVMVEGFWTNDVPPVFVPGVFPGQEYTAERPDVVPEKFRVAVPTLSTEISSAGTAVPPTLGIGDLFRRETQKSTFIKRVLQRFRSLVGLPVSLVGKDTNQNKQVVTVAQTLRNTGPDPVPTALQETRTENLGDGTFLDEVRSVAALFNAKLFAKSRPDPAPEEFRVLREATKTEQIIEGIAAIPTLGVGELEKSEQQIDSFTKRISTTSRDLTTSGVLLDGEIDGVNAAGSFFSSITSITRTFASIVQAVEEHWLVLRSKVHSLGDGSSVRDTERVTGYPALRDTVTDPTDGTITFRDKYIQPAGTPNPGAFWDTLAIDGQRVAQVHTIPDAASFDSFRFVFDGTTNVDLPPQLLDVTGFVEASAEGGSFSEIGSYAITGHGSAGIALACKGQGGTAVITDVSYNVKQLWGQNVPCKHFLFLTNGGKTVDEIVVILNAISGLNIAKWPKFVPASFNIFCRGEKVLGTANASVTGNDSFISNYLGDLIDNASSRTHGSGASFDVGVSLKVVRLPPTIHAQINVSIPSVLTQTVNAAAQINVTGLSASNLGVTVQAAGSIYPAVIPATTGQSTIPTSGYRLHRFVTEPYKNGYLKVHAEVVNFADLN